jgi:uncharacterized protein (TIGR00369 family)
MCPFSARQTSRQHSSMEKSIFEPHSDSLMTQPMSKSQYNDPPIPEGFAHLDRGSPFVALLGPIFHKTSGRHHVIGLRIEHKHTNIRGIAHGGMLVTLADTALGIALSLETDGKRPMVTANLSTDFLDAAHPGDWVEAHVDIQRIGARLAFASCHLMIDGKRILRASGVFAGSTSG